MIYPTAKVSEQVNRNCRPRNMILQLSTPPEWIQSEKKSDLTNPLGLIERL